MSLNDKAISKDDKFENNLLEDLFVAYQKPLYHFVYRYTQDEQLSIDIVQDTFVKFHKYQATYDQSKSSIKTFLFRIAYQVMINKVNRRKRLRSLLPFVYKENEHVKLAIEERLTVQEAIKALPEEQRAVIILTYYHDLTQKEIAEILQIPVGTVKSRVHGALKKLKAWMEVE